MLYDGDAGGKRCLQFVSARLVRSLSTLCAQYAEQGLCNGRLSVRPSVPSIDSSSGACDWFAAKRGRVQQMSIDSCGRRAQQQMRVASC